MYQTALLTLQPPLPRLICQVTNVPVHVAGSVQPSRERWDSRGHAFAPSVSRGNRARMWERSVTSCNKKASHSEKTCVCSICISKQLSTHVTRKDPKGPSLLLTRKLRTAIKRVQSNLVLTTVPESRRKLVPRKTATFARSMGAHTRHTILVIAVRLRKTKWKSPISVPLRKAERNPIPQSSVTVDT